MTEPVAQKLAYSRQLNMLLIAGSHVFRRPYDFRLFTSSFLYVITGSLGGRCVQQVLSTPHSYLLGSLWLTPDRHIPYRLTYSPKHMLTWYLSAYGCSLAMFYTSAGEKIMAKEQPSSTEA